MSRQYLKQLKQRAERLLEASSDNESASDEEDVNAYTATHAGTRSLRRITLQLPEQQEPEEVSEFYEHETTDIEMLKKCIALSNENSNLKLIVEKLAAQAESLREELRSKEQAEKDLMARLDKKGDKMGELLRIEQAMAIIEDEKRAIQEERLTLRKKAEQLEQERTSFRRELEVSIRQRRNSQKQGRREIQVQEDYTIRNLKRQDGDKLRQRNQQLQQRVKRLQQVVRQQRGKSARLCRFINREVPQLSNIIVQLTAKMDAKFERTILRALDAQSGV